MPIQNDQGVFPNDRRRHRGVGMLELQLFKKEMLKFLEVIK
jgi:hypothetical protein